MASLKQRGPNSKKRGVSGPLQMGKKWPILAVSRAAKNVSEPGENSNYLPLERGFEIPNSATFFPTWRAVPEVTCTEGNVRPTFEQ